MIFSKILNNKVLSIIILVVIISLITILIRFNDIKSEIACNIYIHELKKNL